MNMIRLSQMKTDNTAHLDIFASVTSPFPLIFRAGPGDEAIMSSNILSLSYVPTPIPGILNCYTSYIRYTLSRDVKENLKQLTEIPQSNFILFSKFQQPATNKVYLNGALL